MKRTISVIMAAALVLASVPMQSFAEETIVDDYAETEVTENAETENAETKITETENLEEESATSGSEEEEQAQTETEDATEQIAADSTEDSSDSVLVEVAESDDEIETETVSDESEILANDIEIVSIENENTTPAAIAEVGTTGEENGFEYKVLEDGTAEITGYSGAREGDLIIPNKIGTYKVVSIGEGAFDTLNDFTGDLILPEGLTSIGSAAFACLFENDIQLPASLTDIWGDSFKPGQKIINQSEKLTLHEGTDHGSEIVHSGFYWCHMESDQSFYSGTVPTGKSLVFGSVGLSYADMYLNRRWCMRPGEKIKLWIGYKCPDEYKSFLHWSSSDETAATVDADGNITAVGEGECEITLTLASNSVIGRFNVYATRYRVKTQVGDLCWYTPEKIRLGYNYREYWDYPVMESNYVWFLFADNLPKGSVTGGNTGNHLSTGEDWTNYFSFQDASGYTNAYNADSAYYGRSWLDRPCAIYPGTVIFQASIQGADGTEIQKLGDPYVVTIEEPVIKTNEPKNVEIGDSITLSAELQNTDLVNEPVPETPEGDTHDYVGYSIYHNLVYQPEFIIEEGADLVELSNGDFSHTLKASEQLKFTGEGTVKIKVKYRQSYRCTCEAAANWNYYEPEKTITIQVNKELPTESDQTPDQDPNSGAAQSPDQNLDQGSTGVSSVAVQVSSVTLDKTASVAKGKSITLKIDIAPADASDKSVTWSSSNPKVATVNGNGTVTGKNYGIALITAGAADGSGVSAQCKVTVGRKGYQVKNWYSDKKCKKKVKNTDASAASGKTLYAKWTKISLGKAAITSLKNNKKKKAVLKIKKIKDAEGYEIVYGTNKKLKKNAQTITTKKPSATLKGLAKKTYFVKVRAYKTDSTGAKVYGKYSAVKKVKISK